MYNMRIEYFIKRKKKLNGKVGKMNNVINNNAIYI